MQLFKHLVQRKIYLGFANERRRDLSIAKAVWDLVQTIIHASIKKIKQNIEVYNLVQQMFCDLTGTETCLYYKISRSF